MLSWMQRRLKSERAPDEETRAAELAEGMTEDHPTTSVLQSMSGGCAQHSPYDACAGCTARTQTLTNASQIGGCPEPGIGPKATIVCIFKLICGTPHAQQININVRHIKITLTGALNQTKGDQDCRNSYLRHPPTPSQTSHHPNRNNRGDISCSSRPLPTRAQGPQCAKCTGDDAATRSLHANPMHQRLKDLQMQPSRVNGLETTH
jgi:hypothetical protein